MLGFLILICAIYLGKKEENISPIENNTERGVGIVQLNITNKNGNILINKQLLNTTVHFIACIGRYGEGKSTFGSTFYKLLYNVKNDYFESSHSFRSFTKGIWMLSKEEWRKIPGYKKYDILDVQGFTIYDSTTWTYVKIVAFLSNHVIILNKGDRYEEVFDTTKIIEKALKQMQEKNIPRILKIIYIQTIKKMKNQ